MNAEKTMDTANGLAARFAGWAKARERHTRRLGIWGLYFMCLDSASRSDGSSGDETYIEELARLEQTFAVARLTRTSRTAGTHPAGIAAWHQSRAASPASIEEQV